MGWIIVKKCLGFILGFILLSSIYYWTDYSPYFVTCLFCILLAFINLLIWNIEKIENSMNDDRNRREREFELVVINMNKEKENMLQILQSRYENLEKQIREQSRRITELDNFTSMTTTKFFNDKTDS